MKKLVSILLICGCNNNNLQFLEGGNIAAGNDLAQVGVYKADKVIFNLTGDTCLLLHSAPPDSLYWVKRSDASRIFYYSE